MASTADVSPRRPKKKTGYDAAAICTPGFEPFCLAELKSLGIRAKQAAPGVLEFSANRRQLYSANVWLRTASRVVVRVAKFRATDFPHLESHAMTVDWKRWLGEGRVPKFRISTNDSKLFHTKAIAQRLHQIAGPPSTGELEQLFVVRIERNTVSISVDSSGGALHHRSWRQQLGEAPLRASMAAAMLLASKWDPSTALIDPFCGAGTIVIEAALLREGMPPGGERAFAFHDWPDFDAGSWASVAGSIDASIEQAALALGSDRPVLYGSDRDSTMIDLATANADRAYVSSAVSFEEKPVSHLSAIKGPGLVLTNPPYGKRLGAKSNRSSLGGLYGRFGAVARERLPEYDVGLLTSDASLARAADSNLKPTMSFRHGGLGVALYSRSSSRANGDTEAYSRSSKETETSSASDVKR